MRYVSRYVMRRKSLSHNGTPVGSFRRGGGAVPGTGDQPTFLHTAFRKCNKYNNLG